MFFKQPPEVGKLTHIIISAHGRAGANTGADIWKGGGLRQRQKNIRTFFKKRIWDYGSGRKGKDLPHTYPENSVHARKLRTKYLQQSFAKLLPLLPPNPLKPPWAGRFKGWWHHIF